MNAVVGTITVLTRTTNTVLLDRDARTSPLRSPMRCNRSPLPTVPPTWSRRRSYGPVIDLVGDAGGDHRSSMTTDRVNGVPSEWRVRNLDVIQCAGNSGSMYLCFRHLTTLVRLGLIRPA